MVMRAIDPPGPPVMRRVAAHDAAPTTATMAMSTVDDAPERQLAPHAAAIDDEIGIERHGLIPSN